MSNYIQVIDDKVVAFVGPKATSVYAMRVLSVALEGYTKHGMLLNRAYTPKAMLQAAERWTGQSFKGKDKYNEAAQAVRLKADDTQREFLEVRRG